MQTVSHRLFAAANLLNVNVVLEQASQMFQEVSTEASLMENFSDLVSQAFGTTEVVFLRPEKAGSYIQAHPVQADEKPLRFQSGNAVTTLLMRDHEAFTVDTLHRMRPGPLVTGALEELETIGAALAIGSFMRKEMKAILLLFPKKSGRIYDLRDQRALQLLCDQLAVALENANLYTAVQNGKIYNDILLDSLTSGIVAVNSDRTVTVFNQRAQRLTGLSESAVVDKPMTMLPPSLVESLQIILNTEAGFRDKDMFIRFGDEEIPLRVSGSMFCGHTGKLLGALLVFNDMTVLKKMEEQIRRTDRLSSIGTLSAGMAHEIKNPLVTIKTFTQLLPQQYSDAEFRHTFFDLVGQEVKRIDTIVNRLLNFARPAKASLRPVSLHEIIENSMRLVEQQLAQHEIIMERHLDARRHIIEADAEQLNQTFINFFLNAIHAMNKGGKLTVRTSVIKHSQDIPLVTGMQNGDSIHVDIQDTGCGITPQDLSKIFDPFFTTKEDGVGLGLSVSHGIIQEHNGAIDVESEKGKGTVFHVQFPLLKPQEKKEE
jgi:PAS domain S-box-containing protein